MAPSPPVLPHGTLDLLVLRALAGGPNHGYGILIRLHDASANLLRIEEGSLYPALHRLETAGLLAAEWRLTDTNRRARVYRLTPKGRRHLAGAQRQWEQMAEGVARVLRFA